jgi:hypothetical protein
MAAMAEVPAIAVSPTEAFFSKNASVIGKFVTQINCIYTEVLIFRLDYFWMKNKILQTTLFLLPGPYNIELRI